MEAGGASRSGTPGAARHGHATLLLCQGVHPKVVSERLGHATVGITLDIYSLIVTAPWELRERLGRNPTRAGEPVPEAPP